VPIALVSLVAEDCQWFKSRQGLAAAETERRISFCGHAILASEPFIVPDTLLDERFKDNPLVTGDPFIRFYAGVPIADQAGQNIGTLCIIDREPHRFDGEEISQLMDLGHWVESEIRLARPGEIQRRMIAELDDTQLKDSLDDLTQCWNRRNLEELLLRSLRASDSSGADLAILLVDIDDFPKVNSTWGQPAGDQILRLVAQKIRNETQPDDILFRSDDNRFLLILNQCAADSATKRAEKIRRSIAAASLKTDAGLIAVSASIGVAPYSPGKSASDPDSVIRPAAEALSLDKRENRNQAIISSTIRS
jgi:diguanylate cyclase (GGDEF)-like protein